MRCGQRAAVRMERSVFLVSTVCVAGSYLYSAPSMVSVSIAWFFMFSVFVLLNKNNPTPAHSRQSRVFLRKSNGLTVRRRLSPTLGTGHLTQRTAQPWPSMSGVVCCTNSTSPSCALHFMDFSQVHLPPNFFRRVGSGFDPTLYDARM
jgi:hypothetical protein